MPGPVPTPTPTPTPTPGPAPAHPAAAPHPAGGGGLFGSLLDGISHLTSPTTPITPATTVGAADTAYGVGDTIGAAANAMGRPSRVLDRMYGDTGAAGALGRFEGGVGSVLGGMSLVNGIDEMRHGQAGQGALDVTAGGLGIAGGLQGLGLLSSAGAMGAIGPAGVVAGLVADGNAYTQQHGWWGQNADGTNKDSIGWDIDQTTAAARNAHDSTTAMTGSKTLGDLAGLANGIGAGIGNTAIAAGGDLLGGVIDTGQTLVGAGVGAARFAGEVFTDPAQAARDAASFGGSVVNFGQNAIGAAGNLIGSVGNGLAAAAHDPLGTANAIATGAGNALGTVGNAVGSVASGAGNVISGFASDVASDAGNVVNGLGGAVNSVLSW